MENLIYSIEPLKKLDDLIGMDLIKKNIIDQILFYGQGLNTNEMMHTCLTGPPGVGKTTLGKILAELYCSLGFLETSNFRVVSRADLVAGYVGQTAIKTLKVLNSSKGGVLFIDEAYSLGVGEDENKSSFGKECIDTINKFLSENTSDFVMIIAGYKEELDKCFFSQNKGLQRRFPWRYDLQEYSPKNLKEIFEYQVSKNGWYIDSEVTDEILDTFFKNNKEIFKNNGGDTLILFDKSKIVHSRRVFGKHHNYKKFLNLSDLENALKIMQRPKPTQKEVPFGMYI
jgi:SpoVK/Ycf46/Vps4 family AAA+-type ATPase